MITRASILQVKQWMGHADVDTTMKYLHYAPKTNEAQLVARAFAADLPSDTASNLAAGPDEPPLLVRGHGQP